ncbi:hypothetical protein HJFPF1_01013 [Paramyrothecium foliicola]|nr:hypothetical protein HJFPF1_01013 [Paramyrothecium foliicola]
MFDAVDRLLCAPELIELILLELDHSTLLCRANRVSRQWHEIIATSPEIQSMLFFKPINVKPGATHAVEFIENSQMWKSCWRLQDLFRKQDPQVEKCEGQIALEHSFDELVPPQQPSPTTAPYTLAGSQTLCHSQSDLTCRGVSWRRMLIQQPAITCIGQIVIRRRLDGSTVTEVGKAHCPDGIRIGHVWDTLRESMVHLKSDVCLMRLVWWEPTLSALEKALYPMADDVLRLFDEGAQMVIALGFSECAPTDKFYGTFSPEYDALCLCEEFEPLDFQMKKTITPARPSRRRAHAA